MITSVSTYSESMFYVQIETSVAHPEDNGKVKTVRFWLAGLRADAQVGLSHEHQNIKWAGLEVKDFQIQKSKPIQGHVQYIPALQTTIVVRILP